MEMPDCEGLYPLGNLADPEKPHTSDPNHSGEKRRSSGTTDDKMINMVDRAISILA